MQQSRKIPQTQTLGRSPVELALKEQKGHLTWLFPVSSVSLCPPSVRLCRGSFSVQLKVPLASSCPPSERGPHIYSAFCTPSFLTPNKTGKATLSWGTPTSPSLSTHVHRTAPGQLQVRCAPVPRTQRRNRTFSGTQILRCLPVPSVYLELCSRLARVCPEEWKT